MPAGDFVPPRPFTGGDQKRRENRGEENSDAGTEQSHLDGVANKENAAKRERKPADPDDPLCAEPFLQGRARWRRRGCSRCRCGRLRSSAAATGSTMRAAAQWLVSGSQAQALRPTRLATGSRRLQLNDTKLQPPDAIAGVQRHHQCDDGDNRNRQDQKYKSDHRIARPPGWMSHGNATLPGESRIAAVRILWAARLEQIEPERVAFGGGIAEADGVDCADHAAVALEQAVRDRDDA